jgi:hypothetical protein
MKIAGLVLCFSVSCVAFAQTTWQGLKFGMSEQDARKQYQRTLEKVPAADGSFQLVDSAQKLTGGNPDAGWQAAAHLYFDKGSKLAHIEVVMTDPLLTASGTSATGDSFAAISVLTEKLVQKYGEPISHEGECGLTVEDVFYSPPQKIFSCKKLWRAADQTIQLDWSVQYQRLRFFSLEYEPLPSDI